jgi:hypothetical protein
MSFSEAITQPGVAATSKPTAAVPYADIYDYHLPKRYQLLILYY